MRSPRLLLTAGIFFSLLRSRPATAPRLLAVHLATKVAPYIPRWLGVRLGPVLILPLTESPDGVVRQQAWLLAGRLMWGEALA